MPDVEDWLVACLCAAWCGSCRDYRSSFAEVARAHPGVRFVWVDIEDEADALAPFDLDVENFPTLLIARGDELRFLGALTPQPATLVQTLAAAQRETLMTQPQPLPHAGALPACVREIGRTVI